MKSFEQLGRAAYEAGKQELKNQGLTRQAEWANLPKETQQVWVAVAKAVAAEIATVL
nr:hypothetical protein [uncultured Albidiferax sp.]